MNHIDKKLLFDAKVRELINEPHYSQIDTVLYSTVDTLTAGDFYLLGFNPGGKPEGTPVGVIVPTESKWHESWEYRGKPCRPGEHPLQLRCRYLIEHILGRDLKLEDVCSSNLIFIQSKDKSGIKYPYDADKCWLVHEYLINDVIKPKVILAFGKTTYEYVAGKYVNPLLPLFGDQSPENEDGKRGWKCYATNDLSGAPRLIIGLPHLSWYQIASDSKTETRSWIKKKVDAALG